MLPTTKKRGREKEKINGQEILKKRKNHPLHYRNHAGYNAPNDLSLVTKRTITTISSQNRNLFSSFSESNIKRFIIHSQLSFIDPKRTYFRFSFTPFNRESHVSWSNNLFIFLGNGVFDFIKRVKFFNKQGQLIFDLRNAAKVYRLNLPQQYGLENLLNFTGPPPSALVGNFGSLRLIKPNTKLDFVLPLNLIHPMFDTGKVLPFSLMNGSYFEFEFHSPQQAMTLHALLTPQGFNDWFTFPLSEVNAAENYTIPDKLDFLDYSLDFMDMRVENIRFEKSYEKYINDECLSGGLAHSFLKYKNYFTEGMDGTFSFVYANSHNLTGKLGDNAQRWDGEKFILPSPIQPSPSVITDYDLSPSFSEVHKVGLLYSAQSIPAKNSTHDLGFKFTSEQWDISGAHPDYTLTLLHTLAEIPPQHRNGTSLYVTSSSFGLKLPLKIAFAGNWIPFVGGSTIEVTFPAGSSPLPDSAGLQMSFCYDPIGVDIAEKLFLFFPIGVIQEGIWNFPDVMELFFYSHGDSGSIDGERLNLIGDSLPGKQSFVRNIRVLHGDETTVRHIFDNNQNEQERNFLYNVNFGNNLTFQDGTMNQTSGGGNDNFASVIFDISRTVQTKDLNYSNLKRLNKYDSGMSVNFDFPVRISLGLGTPLYDQYLFNQRIDEEFLACIYYLFAFLPKWLQYFEYTGITVINQSSNAPIVSRVEDRSLYDYRERLNVLE